MLLVGAVLYGLYIGSEINYLLFHSVIEVTTIIIGFCVFILAWNLQRISRNNYLIFLGIAFFSFSALDLVHTFTYKGIEIIPGYDTNLPTQLWIAARYLQSISFLIAPIYLHRKLKINFVLAVYLLVMVLLLASIFSSIFPVCYIEGSGLTPFKIISEYVISSIFVGSIFTLRHKRDHFDIRIYRWLVTSIILSILSELEFTTYISVYGFASFAGHILKLFAFFFIYKAIIAFSIYHLDARTNKAKLYLQD